MSERLNIGKIKCFEEKAGKKKKKKKKIISLKWEWQKGEKNGMQRNLEKKDQEKL